MSPSRQRLAALSVGVPAGLIALACIAMLGWSYASARARAPGDEQRVTELQEKATTDAAFALELADEQARQTEARQARTAANGRVTIVLIGAAAVFVTCMKWLVTLRGRSAPPPATLVQLRLPPDLDTKARTSTATAPSSPEPDAIDLAFVDDLVAGAGRSTEAAIPILQAIQSHYRYLPDRALDRVCELTDITPAQIAGTSSFYAQFRRTPVGAHVVRVCHGTACHVSGARQVTDELRRHLAIPDGADTDAQRRFTLDEVACLGCCSLAPVLMIDDHTAGKLTPLSACDALHVVVPEPSP